MKTIRLLGFITIMLIASRVSAQYNFSATLELSANNTIEKYSDPDDESPTLFMMGYGFGLNMDYAFRTNLKLRTGLKYTVKGYSLDLNKIFESTGLSADGYNRYYFNYIDIPVLLVTDVSNFLEISFGPYIGIGIGGKNKYNYVLSGELLGLTINRDEIGSNVLVPVFSEDAALNTGSNEIAYYGLDYGLLFGISYSINDMFDVGLLYNQGLSNVTAPYGDDRKNNKMYLYSLSLNLTVNF